MSRRVAVIGAGVSGMALGIRLRRTGHDFTIFEKGPTVGGTWRDNRYPGLLCDVPAFTYTFSTDRHIDSPRLLAGRDVILGYLTEVFERHGLGAHTRFDSEIVRATWTGSGWQLESVHGDEGVFDVVVHACGFLHHPHVPDIPGLDRFEGPVFHSARWDDSVELDGRRVGIVGTGSTGVQLTCALSERSDVVVFQRTPQWVFPFPDLPVPALLRRLLRRRPGVASAMAEGVERFGDWFIGDASRRDGLQRTLFRIGCTLNLRRVRDAELRRRLTPTGEPMCKRPVMSRDYYRVVQRPNVALADAPIEAVTPTGIRTVDGVEHDLDVVVLATGFDAHAYMRPMEVIGPEGRSLADEWRDGPIAYRSIALCGFPNMFLMLGPHAPLLSVAIHNTAERESEYIVQMLDTLEREGVPGLSPTRRATDEWARAITEGLRGTVWDGDCSSWYIDRGGLPIIWPYDRDRWFDTIAAPDPAHYEPAVDHERRPMPSPARGTPPPGVLT